MGGRLVDLAVFSSYFNNVIESLLNTFGVDCS